VLVKESVMGAWGEESCSNDSCWDALCFGGIEEIHEITQEEVKPCLDKLDTEKTSYGAFYGESEDFLGCVIWILRQGLVVEVKYIEKAKAVAEKCLTDEESLSRWCSKTARLEHLNKEIREMQSAIENDGQGIKEHIPSLFEKLGGCLGASDNA